MIVIVDYGVGNLSSVANMLRKAGGEVLVSRDPADVLRADKLLLPGGGHFDYGVKMLGDPDLHYDSMTKFVLYTARLGLVRGYSRQDRALSI